jgi:hypothetical protein
MVFDSNQGRTVLFGGNRWTGSQNEPLTDIWAWNGDQWVSVSSTPRAREYHVMAFDSSRGVTVLVGGRSYYNTPLFFNDTWEWDGTFWSRRATTGPMTSDGYSMAFDSARHRTVLFGVATTGWPTWEWDGTNWLQAATGGPGRTNAGMAFDANRGVTVLFGGIRSGNQYLGDTWEWDGQSWGQRAVSGPSARTGLAMAYDSARHVVVLFGGFDGIGPLGDTWEWDGSSWVQQANSGPPARSSTAMTYDSARGVVTMFGGVGAGNAMLGDTWEWDGQTWTQRMVSLPLSRGRHSMAYDSVRGVSLLFGGNLFQIDGGDMWEFHGPCTDPRVVAQPASAVACRSAGSIFSVGSVGGEPRSHAWQVQTGDADWLTISATPLSLPCGGSVVASSPSEPTTSITVTPCNGVNRYQIRCVVSNSCGSSISNQASLTVNTADFNGDGDIGTDADIEAFFACLGGTCCSTCGSADYNGDGDLGTDADIEAFFRVIAGGSC